MNPTNLYQFYTRQGKKLPTVSERVGDATKAGINNYTGTADQNNQLLNYLSNGATNPNISTPAKENYINSQSKNIDPNITTTPSAKDAYIQAYKNYQNAQTQNTDVANAKSAYNDFIANQAKSIAGREGRGLGIPLQIVRGEQEKLLKQTEPEAKRLQNAIDIEQDRQTGNINAAKVSLDLNKNLLDLETETEKEKRNNERLSNPSFELSAGQTRYQYDPVTKTYKQVAAIAPKPSTATPKGTITSGGLKYTVQDQAEDSKALEESRGTDGYVDPTIYQTLYKAWIDNGGLLKDFLTRYPPKNYVNPANTWLPPYLMPTKSTGGQNA